VIWRFSYDYVFDLGRYHFPMAEIAIDKGKFDALLKKMLDTPPLPKSEVKVANPKPKKKRKKSAA